MEQIKSVKKAHSALVVKAPPGGQKTSGNLATRDVQKLEDELVSYREQYADLYKRREQREWAEFYFGFENDSPKILRFSNLEDIYSESCQD
jgi:hypothetical protein